VFNRPRLGGSPADDEDGATGPTERLGQNPEVW
jgi:hypothetical protein